MIPTAVQVRDMEVKYFSDGGFEVRFEIGCFVTYNRYGERGHHGNNCKNKQLERADETAGSQSGTHASTSDDFVPEGQMHKYCQGEASAELNTRPTNISTFPMERRANQYVAYGQSPQSGSNVTSFERTFNQHGVFKGVNVTMWTNQGNPGSNDSEIPSAAKHKCRDMFGGPTEITQVSPLRPGYW